MLKIFICEDNDKQRERFTKFIEDFIVIENFDMKIALATRNPEDIIKYVSKNDISGLYFLDVDLKHNINGIKLASKIRKYDPRGFIVFITTHGEMAPLTFKYKVEAMDYIIKDSDENLKDNIRKCIIDANTKYSGTLNKLQKNFSMKINGRIVNVEFRKILFFETSSKVHKIALHATDRQVEFYAKMKDIEDKLDGRFFRCHRSYLVNKDNIKEIDSKKKLAYMVNGEKCLISVRTLKKLVDN
jgi:two-component system response regulator AgrA